MDPPPPPADERILHAALDLFGRNGVHATPLSAIAAAAGVSPALIIHHYRSKAGLRRACDDHVVSTIRATKERAIRDETTNPDSTRPPEALDHLDELRPLMRYLARILVSGGPHVDALVDDLIENALAYTALAEDAGLVQASEQQRDRMRVLVLWSLGALVLHDQMDRLLHTDLLTPGGDITGYLRPAMEVLSTGLLAPGAFDRYAQAAAPPDPTTRQGDLT